METGTYSLNLMNLNNFYQHNVYEFLITIQTFTLLLLCYIINILHYCIITFCLQCYQLKSRVSRKMVKTAFLIPSNQIFTLKFVAQCTPPSLY